MRSGAMTPRQGAAVPAAFASIGSFSGAVSVRLPRWMPGGDGPTGERRRAEDAAARPDRGHRPIAGPVPAAVRRGTTHGPIHATVHPGERETRTGPAVTPGIRTTSPGRESVVHRGKSYDGAGRLARRVAERPHAVPATPTAGFSSDRDDPTRGPAADDLVEWSVPDGGAAPLIGVVATDRSGPTGTTSVGRGVSPGGGATRATAAR